jgi:hypothetical protein
MKRMNAMLSVQKVQQEARLMFSLIDAFDCGKPAPRPVSMALWQELRKRVDASGNYEEEAASFHEILTGLDESGALSGTWIEVRWRAAQSRMAQEE